MRVYKKWYVWLFMLAVLLTGCAAIPPVEPYLAEEREARWENDLDYLAETLPEVHKDLFFRISREEFMSRMEDLKAKIPLYSDAQMAVALHELLASVGDTHSGSSLALEYRYPLELRWFADGIYVMATDQAHEELLGARILSLNGETAEAAAEALRPMFIGANESWFKNQSVYYLVLPEVLRYYGIVDTDGGSGADSDGDGGGLAVTAELLDGGERTVTLEPVSYQDYIAIAYQPDAIQLCRSRPDERYWYEYLAETDTMYFCYQSCQEMRHLPFEIFHKDFWQAVERYQPDKLVIDIRMNRGGSSPILEPFIKKVRSSEFNQEGRLYVITGKDTYSSAVLNALRLRSRTDAHFVGEATGGAPNHYGEVKQFTLPNHEINIRYSTKYFHWLDEETDTLVPDTEIEELFADYRRGHDPVLEWINSQ